MSKKGCSPDNATCEGFFGRMKNEMFHGRSWIGTTASDFIRQIEAYMKWYTEERVKVSLGGRNPQAYRFGLKSNSYSERFFASEG